MSLALKHGVSRDSVIERIRKLRSGVVSEGSLAGRVAYLVNQSPEAVDAIERLMTRAVKEGAARDE